ncbi:hypothetical protein CHARACLAT_027259 [Characodon lateralis]|uniref:Uncharacterized protein n=1 Tax=Characodon lateralis TaxID=208331 RepID=A0ABU7EZQ6_9TELE|nr:hypothetical protein [Characodon lateralis]
MAVFFCSVKKRWNQDESAPSSSSLGLLLRFMKLNATLRNLNCKSTLGIGSIHGGTFPHTVFGPYSKHLYIYHSTMEPFFLTICPTLRNAF